MGRLFYRPRADARWGEFDAYILRNRPFPSDILKAGLEQLTEELKKASLGRVGNKRAEALAAIAQQSIGVKQGLEGARVKLTSCLDEIEFYMLSSKRPKKLWANI